MTTFGFVTGLRAETKILETTAKRTGRATPRAACAGAHAGRAQDGAARLIAQGARVIVSFGLCGGLGPSLRPGALILATSVVDRAGQSYDTDADTRGRLSNDLVAAGLSPIGGLILGDDEAAATVMQKAKLYDRTGAVAVDMESHGVALAAHEAGIPFLVVRAVADPAARDLPHAALVATREDGGIHAQAVMTALIRRPWEIGAMLRLARDARVAFATLKRAAETLLRGG